jgi:hypothetical protein
MSKQELTKHKLEWRHPKSGPRKYIKGDSEKYEEGYNRIFNKSGTCHAPICPLCQGRSEAESCPGCA